MFDSSERWTSRLSTQLAPKALQNWSQILRKYWSSKNQQSVFLTWPVPLYIHTYIYILYAYITWHIYMYVHVCTSWYMYVCMYMYITYICIHTYICHVQWNRPSQKHTLPVISRSIFSQKKIWDQFWRHLGASCVLRRLVKRSEESNMENLFLPFTVYFSAGTKYLSMG